MEDKSNFTTVPITGGLGNQLFQLSAGISCALQANTELRLETSLGSPRKSENGRVELLDLMFDCKLFQSSTTHLNLVPRKLFNFLLSEGLRSGEVGESNMFRFAKNISGKFLSVTEKSKAEIFTSNNLGYVEIDDKKNLFLIGYFQSYRYFEVPQVKDIMQSAFTMGEYSLEEIFQLAEIDQPLVVHVRRGDYRNEKKFGLLSADYYNLAIEWQMNKFPYGRIWLFSDEIEFAKTLIPRKYQLQVRVIASNKVSSARTLEVMKKGKGFVLANSSFGYWAAQLSGVSGSRIMAPSPWFRDIVEPRDLINPEWERIDAAWED